MVFVNIGTIIMIMDTELLIMKYTRFALYV